MAEEASENGAAFVIKRLKQRLGFAELTPEALRPGDRLVFQPEQNALNHLGLALFRSRNDEGAYTEEDWPYLNGPLPIQRTAESAQRREQEQADQRAAFRPRQLYGFDRDAWNNGQAAAKTHYRSEHTDPQLQLLPQSEDNSKRRPTLEIVKREPRFFGEPGFICRFKGGSVRFNPGGSRSEYDSISLSELVEIDERPVKDFLETQLFILSVNDLAHFRRT